MLTTCRSTVLAAGYQAVCAAKLGSLVPQQEISQMQEPVGLPIPVERPRNRGAKHWHGAAQVKVKLWQSLVNRRILKRVPLQRVSVVELVD